MTQNKAIRRRLYKRVIALRGDLKVALDIVEAQADLSIEERRLSIRSSLVDLEA